MWTEAQVQERVQKKRNEWGGHRWGVVWTALRDRMYYNGRQNIVWNGNTYNFTLAPREPGRLQLVMNYIRNTVFETKNLLIKDLPGLSTIPQDPQDIREQMAAQVSDQIMEGVFNENKWNRLTSGTIVDMLANSVGFNKVVYDGTKGESLPDTVDGSKLNVGDIHISRPTIFDLWLPPGINFIDDALEMWEERLVHKDVVKDIWKNAQVDSADTNFTDVRAYLMSTTGAPEYTATGSGTYPLTWDYVPVTEYWRRPTAENPKGIKAIIIKDEVMWMGELPTDKKGKVLPLPYFEYKHQEDLYHIAPPSFVSQLVDAQKGVNAMFTSFIEGMRAHGHDKWCFFEDTLLGGSEQADSDPAHFWELRDDVTREKVPFHLVGSPPNSGWIQGMEMAKDAVKDLGYSGGIRSGGGVPGERTALAYSMASERNDDQLNSYYLDMEVGFKGVGKMVLQLAQKHYTEKRLLQYTSEAGEVEVGEFTAADMSNSTEVLFGLSSRRSSSRVARTQEAMALFSGGFIDKREFWKLYGGRESVADVSEDRRDEKFARYENLNFIELGKGLAAKPPRISSLEVIKDIEALNAWAMGGDFSIPPTLKHLRAPTMIENHTIHEYEHRMVRKSTTFAMKYEKLIGRAIDAHDNVHEAMQMAKMQKEMLKQQMLAQGGQQGPPEMPGVPSALGYGPESEIVQPPTGAPQAPDGIDVGTLGGPESGMVPPDGMIQ